MKPEWRGYEMNEAGWWAKWADLDWVDRDCYVLFSDEFREPFFNRAGFVGLGRGFEGSVDALEGRFAERQVSPRMYVQEAPGWRPLREHLSRRGYRVVDSMSVMKAGKGKVASAPDVRVEAAEQSLDEWSRTYLRAFYGRTALMPAVEHILEKAAADERVSLLIARIDGDPAGCAAVYRTDRLLGAYCIGTVAKFRRRKVGSTVLGAIRELARGEGREVALQTMLSDSVEDFYLKRGFGRVYIKSVFERVRRR